MRGIDGRRLGRAAGVVLAAVSLVGIFVPARAQTSGDGPTEEPAKVEREAYFTAPSNGALPATLTKEFPPGIACILAPQVCSSTTQPITGAIGGVVAPVTGTKLPDAQGPQPVQPGTLPVGMLGGKPRYTSYLKVTLPAIPSGSLVDRFDLVLTQTDVSYALESPAFRAAILAGLEAYETKDPATFTEFVGSVANQTNPLAETAPTGLELCAVTAAWRAGGSQDAATQPAKDCIFGANGVYDAAAKTWTFDLSLLAQAWLDGTTPNEGVYLGPIGAENLAFGDPDTSTNWQISLGGGTSATPPKLRYAFSEGLGDEAFGDDGGALTLDDVGLEPDLGGGISDSVDVFAPTFDATFDAGSAGAGAPKATGRTSSTAGSGARRLPATLAAESRPHSPWWLWLLLPLGLGLSYVYGRSAEAEPPAVRSGRGALSRLTAPTDDPPSR
jgi:hypothetical protein